MLHIKGLLLRLPAAMTALAAKRVSPALLPLAAAAAFAITEWLRSIGVSGVPFAQLGVTQVETPLRALGAYIGTGGITFAVFALGAYAAYALRSRSWRAFDSMRGCRRRCSERGVVHMAGASRGCCHRYRLSRSKATSRSRSSGSRDALEHAVNVYTAMTRTAIASHPRLIVWPETVIALYGDGLTSDTALVTKFTALAAQADATILVGSIRFNNGRILQHALRVHELGITGVYDKRQLVPFAEHFPGQQFLWWLPYVGKH